MPQFCRVLTTALVLCGVLAANARGQQLLEVDGIELRGEAQLVMSGGGTCNVLESDTSYEAKKDNDGAPMDIWRLDFSVRNGSGRWLDHLIARFQIESEWPDCTNWDGPDAGELAQPIEWADSIGHIQESGRNVVAPRQTLTETKFFIVLRGDPEPRFSNWSMDFDFATAPPSADSGSPTAPPTASAAQQPPPTATPEQENMFWQSIMDSTNPADFEAYLAQFPNGVFRALAENRLAELRGPGDSPPSRASAGDPSSPVPRLTPICTDEHHSRDVSCWMELSNHPGCYVWNPVPQPNETVTWTAECAGGMVQGTGTITWRYGRTIETNSGYLVDGKFSGEVDVDIQALDRP